MEKLVGTRARKSQEKRKKIMGTKLCRNKLDRRMTGTEPKEIGNCIEKENVW